MIRAIGLFAVSALLAGCEASPSPIPPGAVLLEMHVITSANIGSFTTSGIPDRRRLMVTDDAAWIALWAEINRYFEPPPPVPAVDFGSQTVIVAAMGTRRTGGYAITIESVHESDGTLYVTVNERSPGAGCLLTQAVTAPVHAVRVTGHFASVTFVEKRTVANC